MTKSVLDSPHQRTGVPGPPSPHANSSNANTVECVNQPSDTSVLSEKFYEEQLKPSPAALSSPMGTAIPGIGHSFKPKGDK